MITLDELGAKLMAGHVKNQELPDVARAAILGAVVGGVTQSAVAKAFGVSSSAVSKIIQRFEETGVVESKPRSGRPQALTARDKRHIIQAVRRQPGTPTAQLQSVGGGTSRSTVFRLLREEKRQNRKAPRNSKVGTQSPKPATPGST